MYFSVKDFTELCLTVLRSSTLLSVRSDLSFALLPTVSISLVSIFSSTLLPLSFVSVFFSFKVRLSKLFVCKRSSIWSVTSTIRSVLSFANLSSVSVLSIFAFCVYFCSLLSMLLVPLVILLSMTRRSLCVN